MSLEDIYWWWLDGPLRKCPICGTVYRRDSIRGMCDHAYSKYRARTRK